VPERTDEVVVSYRLPIALDEAERRRDPWPWELIIRNPRSLKIADEYEIGTYDIRRCEVTPETIVIEGGVPLRIEIGVESLDVAVEAPVQSQTAGSL
jgi:hypothetical protein